MKVADMKVADTIGAHLAGIKLSREQKAKAGPAVYYLFGSMGGRFGLLPSTLPAPATREPAGEPCSS